MENSTGIMTNGVEIVSQTAAKLVGMAEDLHNSMGQFKLTAEPPVNPYKKLQK